MVLYQYYSVLCKKKKNEPSKFDILKVNEKIPFKLIILQGKRSVDRFLFLKRGYT